MGWHDAILHGVARFAEDDTSRILFDLDYIVRWVHPIRPEKYFSFWISPATLVFDDVSELQADIDLNNSTADLEIADLHRLPTGAVRADQRQWHIEGHSFDIKLCAAGYRQYIRHPPTLTPRQSLSHAERGGFAFTESGFD